MVDPMAHERDMIMDECNEASASMSCVVDGSTTFQFPTHLGKFFQIDVSTFQHVLGVPDSDLKNAHPPARYMTAAGAEIDPLTTLPDDIIFEILKRLRSSDIRSLRTVSKYWQQAFPSIVHQFPGCAQLPNRKALWICTLQGREEIAFLSNKTCSRRKLYGKVVRFSESEIFPEETTMVASEAGLICLKVSLSTSGSGVSAHLESRSTMASASIFKFTLVVCNPVLMDFRILPAIEDLLQEKPETISTPYTNFGLMVDSHTLSFKVIVASPGVNVRVFDSSNSVWKLGSAPPQGILFSADKNAVTYRRCLYYVAYQQQELTGPSSGKRWFIMRYNTRKDTWRRIADVPSVHQMNSWKICQHFSLPDLVAMSDGVVLIAENDHMTNKHIFRLNKATREWDLIFHVPMFSSYLTSLGPLKCIGVQMNLYFLLPNSLPFLEVDIGSKQWAWCLPAGLHTAHDFRRFSDISTMKVTLPFEPSLQPVSELGGV